MNTFDLSSWGSIASILGLLLAILLAVWGGPKLWRYLRQDTSVTVKGTGNVAAVTGRR